MLATASCASLPTLRRCGGVARAGGPVAAPGPAPLWRVGAGGGLVRVRVPEAPPAQDPRLVAAAAVCRGVAAACESGQLASAQWLAAHFGLTGADLRRAELQAVAGACAAG